MKNALAAAAALGIPFEPEFPAQSLQGDWCACAAVPAAS